MKIGTAFFARTALQVARDLVGNRLVRTVGGKKIEVVITEVMAHEGGTPTQARAGMEYAPGKIFLMPYRGLLFLNIATNAVGVASCVFIRTGIDISNPDHLVVLDGPAKLTKHLRITSGMDGDSLNAELHVEEAFVDPKRVHEGVRGTAENCVGCYTYRCD
jgi:3-methyladenine DNA glycosylase Mpg